MNFEINDIVFYKESEKIDWDCVPERPNIFFLFLFLCLFFFFFFSIYDLY